MHLRGVPKEQIRNALGHHSWDFTESVYVHDESVPDAGVLAGLREESGNRPADQPGLATRQVIGA